MAFTIYSDSQGIRFSVKIVPGASRTTIAGLLGDAVKITVAAAPEKGKANKALIKFLAASLNIPARSIHIVSGDHQVHKEILITGIGADQLRQLLDGTR